MAFLAVAGVFILRASLANTFLIPSASMEPTLQVGERIEIDPDPTIYEVGDIVVFDGSGSFSQYQTTTTSEAFWNTVGSWVGLRPHRDAVVKRIMGTSGDTVQCCTGEGKLTVNGEELDEPYLMEPDRPASGTEFSVEVPQNRVFVMGDNRYNSVDSRDLLGAPGGGMIQEDNIMGVVKAAHG